MTDVREERKRNKQTHKQGADRYTKQGGQTDVQTNRQRDRATVTQKHTKTEIQKERDK